MVDEETLNPEEQLASESEAAQALNDPNNIAIHEVFSISDTMTPGTQYVDADFTDVNLFRDRVIYVLTVGDTNTMALKFFEWIEANPEFPITPYVPPPPPTIEEIRAAMPELQRLDFKTRFKNAGMNLAKINAYFASIEENESHWEDMQNYYAETPTFARLSTFVLELAEFSLKTPEQIDAIWTA